MRSLMRACTCSNLLERETVRPARGGKLVERGGGVDGRLAAPLAGRVGERIRPTPDRAPQAGPLNARKRARPRRANTRALAVRAAFVHSSRHLRMEPALRNRLTFGPIMLAALIVILWLDHAAEGWTRSWMLQRFGVDRGVCGLGLMALLLLVVPPATIELATLFAAERVRPYRIISVLGSLALIA